MSWQFDDLNLVTRAFMIQELDYDVAADSVFGRRHRHLTDEGKLAYVPLLEYALDHGDIAGLAHQLFDHGRFTGDAPARLAGAAFNHYYIRAICRRALGRGDLWVEVYRAKTVEPPREMGRARINALVDPVLLIQDLRTGADGRGPGGPNSGLSARLVPSETDADTADSVAEFVGYVAAPRMLRTPWVTPSDPTPPEAPPATTGESGG